MPSAVTLPTFSDEEILLYETLNALSQAISARFLAGIGVADLAWPLTAEGNLNMSVHNITGGKQIWKFVNAGNYDTLQEALDDAGANGVVLVPPETTVPAATAGHALDNAVSIVGAGVSSVIQMPSGASSDMLRVSGGRGGGLYNLTLDGNSVTGAHSGASLTGATNYVISNVWTTNFTGSGIKVTAGMVSMNVGGLCSDGDAISMSCTGCQNMNLNNVRLKNYSDKGLDFDGGGSTLRVNANNVHTETISGGEGIKVIGSGAVGVGSSAEFNGSNIHIKGATGSVDGLVLGTSADALDRVMLSNVSVEDATANGATVNAGRGTITGCDFDNPTTTGLDLDTSTNVNVSGCHFSDATNGIDMSDANCDGCIISDNSFASVTNHVLRGDNTSSERGNAQLSAGGQQAMFNATQETVTNQTNVKAMTMIIPANTLKAGSVLTCHAHCTQSGNDTARTVQLYINDTGHGSSYNQGSGGAENHHTWIVMIKSATTSSAMWYALSDEAAKATENSYSNTISGIDTTIDQEIELNVSTVDAGSVIIRQFVVIIQQGLEYP